MKSFKTAVLILAALILAAPLAWSQDDVMRLNSEALGKHERPMVIFGHQKHADKLACTNCHHDYDEYLNNTVSDDGMACSECHQKEAWEDNSLPLALAFHRQCKGCHVKFLEVGKKTGPNMCGGCHKPQTLRQAGLAGPG